MGEPQKGTSSANLKEKKSFLDEDIGKDFLSSWKSMSVAEDDAVDFGFTTASSGKKNTFNFGKLDMDFNLDGDFGKLSSFKVDMSDFDFSAPSENAAKPKERSENESSTGNPQGKKNDFSFSFDFNELDGFNFESSLAKEEKASSKNQDDKMEISSDGIGRQGSKLQLDAMVMKLPASEEVATSNCEILLGGPGPLNSSKKDQAKYVSSGAPILSNRARSSPEKATLNSTEAIDQKIHVSENEISKELYTPATVLDFPGQTLNGVDSSRNTSTDGMTESCQQSTGMRHTSSRREDVNEKMVAGVLSCHEDLPLKSSSSLNVTTSGNNKGGENKSDSDISTENVDGDESAEGDLDLEEKSPSSTSKKAPHGTTNNNENCTSRVELHVPHLCSEPMVDEVTLTNENDAGGLCSKFSKMEGTANRIRQSSPFETTSLSGIERSGPRKSSENETEEVLSSKAQTGMELHRNPISVAKELKKVEDVLPMGEKNAKNLNNIRDGFTSNGLPNGAKLVGKSRLPGEEATRRIPIMPASDRNVKDQNTLSPQVSPSSSSGKQGKFNPNTGANSKLFGPSVENVQNITIKPIEGNKHSVVRAGKKMPDLATMKIFRTREAADKVPSDSTPQKDTSSLQKTEQNVEVEGSSGSETSHSFSSNEKKSQMNLSLKRKTLELSNSDLSCPKPLKRLSESLTNSRDLEEPLKRVEEKFFTVGKSLKPLKCLPEPVAESRDVKEPLKRIDIKDSLKRIDPEKVCINKNQVESKAPYNVPAAAIDSPQQVNMMEFEISSVMENDGNVKKAEAYAKELEDICNMLKKKHEEAKEILVRAIVNNNNLLMLNHPIYEEKIRKVQKFAGELMPKELKV